MDAWRTALGWSLPLGRPLGIPLRIAWTVGIVFLWGVVEWARWPGIGAPWAVLLALLSTVLLYVVIWTHELGHAFAAARLGSPAREITLTALGGLAHMSGPARSPRAEALTSIAGPAVHVLWLPLAWATTQVPAQAALGPVPLALLGGYLLQLNLGLLLFNLLPLYPMDGGRVLRALLAHRVHPNLATLWACRVGVIGGIALAAWGLSRPGLSGSLLVLIGVTNALTCLREMAFVRLSEGPYGPATDPWAVDPDAWRRGAAPAREERLWPRLVRGGGRRATPVLDEPETVAPPTAPGPEEPRAPRGRSAAEEAELDALLDRVSTVGLGGLTEAERERLHGLSRSRAR